MSAGTASHSRRRRDAQPSFVNIRVIPGARS